MNTGNEGAKQLVDIKTAARLLAAVMLVVAREVSLGVLDELVGHSLSTVLRTSAMTALQSNDNKPQVGLNQEEAIDV
jgi:hypothetical protein